MSYHLQARHLATAEEFVRKARSINNGSRLTGMRLLMAAVQQSGRYD